MSSFAEGRVMHNVKTILSQYTASTAEDYLWRLCRALQKEPGFPSGALRTYQSWLKQSGGSLPT